MANKLPNGNYECSYCHKEYSHPQKADACRENHDLVYVPISKGDLNRLVQFLYLKDDDLLTNSLVDTLRNYVGGGLTF